MDHRSPPNFQPPPCAAQSLFDTMPTTTVPTLTTPTSVFKSTTTTTNNKKDKWKHPTLLPHIPTPPLLVELTPTPTYEEDVGNNATTDDNNSTSTYDDDDDNNNDTNNRNNNDNNNDDDDDITSSSITSFTLATESTDAIVIIEDHTGTMVTTTKKKKATTTTTTATEGKILASAAAVSTTSTTTEGKILASAAAVSKTGSETGSSRKTGTKPKKIHSRIEIFAVLDVRRVETTTETQTHHNKDDDNVGGGGGGGNTIQQSNDSGGGGGISLSSSSSSCKKQNAITTSSSASASLQDDQHYIVIKKRKAAAPDSTTNNDDDDQDEETARSCGGDNDVDDGGEDDFDSDIENGKHSKKKKNVATKGKAFCPTYSRKTSTTTASTNTTNNKKAKSKSSNALIAPAPLPLSSVAPLSSIATNVLPYSQPHPYPHQPYPVSNPYPSHYYNPCSAPVVLPSSSNHQQQQQYLPPSLYNYNHHYQYHHGDQQHPVHHACNQSTHDCTNSHETHSTYEQHQAVSVPNSNVNTNDGGGQHQHPYGYGPPPPPLYDNQQENQDHQPPHGAPPLHPPLHPPWYPPLQPPSYPYPHPHSNPHLHSYADAQRQYDYNKEVDHSDISQAIGCVDVRGDCREGGDDEDFSDDEGDYNQDDHGVEILDKEITDFISKPIARTSSSESTPKRTKTNKKKELTPFPDRIGITFAPPLVDIAARTTISLPSWPPLKTYCDQHANLSSPLPIATDAKSLENISIMIIKHFPGDVNLEKMIEYGLLWKTKNDYIGEPCLRFLVSFINKMLYAFPDDNTHRKINDSIAWRDICPVPGPNNCGGDHNLPELQDLTTEVLIQFLKKCPNLEKILFFGKNPNIYSIGQFLSQLEKRAPELLPAFQKTYRLGSLDFNSPFRYNPHSQFYLMGLNTKEHTMDLIRVGADVINTVFKIDITQQLMELDDAIVQDIIPFATEAVIEARRQVLSEVMKAHWANPEGPFRNVSELIKAHWANPEGPFRNVSELMKAHWANPEGPFRKMIEDPNSNWWRAMRLGWADPESKFWKGREQASKKLIAFHKAMYSHLLPCPRCGISIRGAGTGMRSHLTACQGLTIILTQSDANWIEMYSKLVEYKMQHDSTAVPQRYTEDPSFWNWVYYQRAAYNKGKLSGKRFELLNSVNFVWSAKKVFDSGTSTPSAPSAGTTFDGASSSSSSSPPTFGSGASTFDSGTSTNVVNNCNDDDNDMNTNNEDDDAHPKKKWTLWTNDQDVAVLLKRTILRKSWRTIGSEIPGRSEQACRNRHSLLIKQHFADSKNALAAITKNALAADSKNAFAAITTEVADLLQENKKPKPNRLFV